MFRSYLAAWGDRNAYAVSHVGFGLNPKARYEALTMYDQRDTNGTEIRAVAGNFLFSTGANEFAGRYTAGHFDLPVMRTTITVDETVVVKDGVVQDVFGNSDPHPEDDAGACAGVSKDGPGPIDPALDSSRSRFTGPRLSRLSRSAGMTVRAPAAGSARNARAIRRTPSAARADRPPRRAPRS